MGWAYLTDDRTVGLPADWSPGDFTTAHLAGFADACLAWRRGHAGRS